MAESGSDPDDTVLDEVKNDKLGLELTEDVWLDIVALVFDEIVPDAPFPAEAEDDGFTDKLELEEAAGVGERAELEGGNDTWLQLVLGWKTMDETENDTIEPNMFEYTVPDSGTTVLDCAPDVPEEEKLEVAANGVGELLVPEDVGEAIESPAPCEEELLITKRVEEKLGSAVMSDVNADDEVRLPVIEEEELNKFEGLKELLAIPTFDGKELIDPEDAGDAQEVPSLCDGKLLGARDEVELEARAEDKFAKDEVGAPRDVMA